MKFTVTKEDLRKMIQKEAGIDISSLTVDLEIEGYVKAKDYRLKATLSTEESINSPRSTVVTDSNLNVISITHEEEKVKPPKKVTKSKRRYTKNKDVYKGRVDYKKYEQQVLDFATCDEDKRRVPTFGLTLTCNKERYKKVIKESKVTDMVRFAQIDSEPYLVRIKKASENALV